ncbi:hypothetical protein Tco_1108647 [Tanacetum coccineum]
MLCDFNKNENDHNEEAEIHIGEHILQPKESFRYLGSVIHKSGRMEDDGGDSTSYAVRVKVLAVNEGPSKWMEVAEMRMVDLWPFLPSRSSLLVGRLFLSSSLVSVVSSSFFPLFLSFSPSVCPLDVLLLCACSALSSYMLGCAYVYVCLCVSLLACSFEPVSVCAYVYVCLCASWPYVALLYAIFFVSPTVVCMDALSFVGGQSSPSTLG